MKAMHTPGPWFSTDRTIYALMHDGWTRGVERQKNRFYAAVQYDKECSEEEAVANARLIASAPDLIEALLLCEGNISSLAASHPVIYTEWLSVVRSAIAKAEGR